MDFLESNISRETQYNIFEMVFFLYSYSKHGLVFNPRILGTVADVCA